jgi:hypothetical protein
MHAQSPVPPLRERSKLAIPSRLEALVMACLAKESGKRPHDADCLRADLLASIDEPPWAAVDARAWWDRQAAVAVSG